jgi:hypothetical protein
MSRRRAGGGLSAALIATGVSLIPGVALAEARDAPAYVLTYAAPGGCPGEATFIADVASHVHDTSRAGSVRVNVTIEEGEGSYAGTLVAFDRTGRESSRRIVDKKCSDVAHALAFLAALVIEVGGHLEPEAGPAPHPAPPPIPSTPAREPAAVARPRSLPAAVLLGGVRGGLGPAVRASAEAGAEIGASEGLVAPSLRVVGFVANGSVDGAGGSASLWLAGGRVELCPLRFASARFALRPCAGTEVGVVQAEGQSAFAPHTVTEAWVTAEATLRGQWFPTAWSFVELGGGPVVALDRTRYYFLPDQTLYVMPVLTARAALGVGLVF